MEISLSAALSQRLLTPPRVRPDASYGPVWPVFTFWQLQTEKGGRGGQVATAAAISKEVIHSLNHYCRW